MAKSCALLYVDLLPNTLSLGQAGSDPLKLSPKYMKSVCLDDLVQAKLSAMIDNMNLCRTIFFECIKNCTINSRLR